MADNKPDDAHESPKASVNENRFTRQWNYRPSVPISTSPLFQWPLKPLAVVRWFSDRWMVFGENLIILLLAVLTWHVFQPSLETTANWSLSWVIPMFMRNALLITIVAGGLHVWLHVKRKQGSKLRFSTTEVTSTGRRFTLNSQLKDNIVWTLGSGVFFWTAFEATMFWAMANGIVPVLHWVQNPIWFIVLFFLTPLWISFHFYWIHRFLHWPPMYKIAHALHHRNTHVGPWSGLSMHPIEHLLFFSSVLIHWVLAAHPIHILFHMQHQALTASTSHAGFDALLVKDKNALALGNFHHQMHHRYFECNYGTLEVPWDKLFGSYHDGTSDSHEQFLKRRRELAGKA